MRASATNIATLHMLAGIWRRAAAQLGCLVLALAIISIPLKGMPAPRPSSLIPLRTTFVPFDTNIQAPELTSVQFSMGVPSGKRTMLASNAISLPTPHQDHLVLCREPDRAGTSGVVALVTGRSPPGA